MSFSELAQNRYSVRKFSEQAVEEEKLQKIIAAACAAPTAVNYQPWHVWVFTGGSLEKIREIAGIRFVTPVVMIVGADTENAWVREYDQHNFAEVDASIVATHIMLEVHDEGLGTVWVGHFNAPKLKEYFPEMAKYELVALFPIGYPAEDALPSPRHSETKPTNALITEYK